MLVSIFFLVGSVSFAAPATLKTSNPIEFEDCGKKSRTFFEACISRLFTLRNIRSGGLSG
jgi:hypothetical protein